MSQSLERYLHFTLGKGHYAMPLLCVREVIAVPEVTPIPFSPAHFLGVMNLRGQVISVIDLRTKLGITPDRDVETAVVICDLGGSPLGCVVDAVHSVLSPEPTELSPKPDLPASRASDAIMGVYRKDRDLVLLLDVAKSLSTEDQQTLKRAGALSGPAAA